MKVNQTLLSDWYVSWIANDIGDDGLIPEITLEMIIIEPHKDQRQAQAHKTDKRRQSIPKTKRLA